MKRSILLGFLICTFLCVIGCGKEKKELNTEYGLDNDGIEYIDVTNDCDEWNATHVSLLNSYADTVIQNNKLYGIRENENGYHIDIWDMEHFELLDDTVFMETDTILDFSVSDEGMLYVMECVDNEFRFHKLDIASDKNEVISLELEDIDEIVRDDVEMKDFYFDDTGNCYIWCNLLSYNSQASKNRKIPAYNMVDRIYVKDRNLQTVYYEDVLNSGYGKILFAKIDETGSFSFVACDEEENLYYEKLDKGSLEKREIEKLDFYLPSDFIEILAVTKDGFIYCEGNVLHEFQVKEKCSKKLFDLSAFGIMSRQIVSFTQNDDYYEVIDYYGEDYHCEYSKIYKDSVDHISVTLGTVYISDDLERCVAEYNRSQQDVQVIMKDYGDDKKGYDSNVQDFKMDLIQGKAPDLMVVDGMGISELSDKNLFVDLNEYLQKDSELKKEDFVQEVLNAYDQNGKLYSLSPMFTIYTMVGKKSIWNESEGISIGEMKEILDFYEKDINAISGFSEEETVLIDLCTSSMDTLIDWKTGNCYFDSEYFREMLDFSKEYSWNEYSLLEGVKKGEILLSEAYISSVSDYQIYKEIYNEDLAFVGYPTENRTGTTIKFLGDDLAINQSSSYKDECWDFMKYYILNGCQDIGFPCVAKLFDEKMSQAMEAKVEIDEEGYAYELCSGSYYEGDYGFDVFEASQEDVKAVKDLISKVDMKREYHQEINNIIYEEAQAYYQDQKSIDEVVEIIQSRVSMYVKEQM